ncbi:four-helix bundle copper-binding protein [Methyloradius palustris]|uniref:four-helix bundle copper-binding protein n=1 Tax=Methyloradius palustris TaxID=2778876 RepID=UPI001C8B113A|nr:four-helix bundle copper-binding protein [Methyloradius palustris]
MVTAQQHSTCIDLCNKAAIACDVCVVACLGEENAAYLRDAILAATDCASFCRLAVGFLARDSQMLQLVCQDCAEICIACAEECAQHPAEHCQLCAHACRKCANECLKMGTTPLNVDELV